MGDQKRMGYSDHTITLYSPQAEVVIDTLERDGICFSRREYVKQKYGESAPIFLAAYDWFVHEASGYVPRPENAEYPYWAFMDPKSVDTSAGNRVLTLHVPIEEAVFFDMYDWSRILCLQYMGKNEAEEKEFRRMLSDYGINRECDVVLTRFYPELKAQVLESWKRLFRFHRAVAAGDLSGLQSVQAGLWCLKKEWLR